jgi:hypothetical protein
MCGGRKESRRRGQNSFVQQSGKKRTREEGIPRRNQAQRTFARRRGAKKRRPEGRRINLGRKRVSYCRYCWMRVVRRPASPN